MKYKYKTQGTCSTEIFFEIQDETQPDGQTLPILHNVQYVGGCNGNLQGISRLVEGKPVREVIGLLQGISCGGGPTSCPDQLSIALSKVLASRE